MEATGKYDFEATREDELSFRAGDVLKILNSRDKWCKAELNGHTGLVPQNYVDMQTPRWFHENTTRSAAEELLRYKDVGNFVIRGCQRSPGDFSISVKYEVDVQHFRVMMDKEGQYFLWSDKFTSLNKLVEFYKMNSISKAREIYLNDSGAENQSSSMVHPLKRGSWSEQRNAARASTATLHRSAHQSHTQLRTPRVQVKALYNFNAEEDDELGFFAGDIIEVLDDSNASWWRGQVRGRSGLFPANYTKQL